MEKTVACLIWPLCLLVIACGSDPAEADLQSRYQAALDEIQADPMMEDVRMLAADEMEGRKAGTAGEEKAAAYIEGRFKEIGLRPVEGSYRQDVELVGVQKVPEESRLTITGPDGPLNYQSDETLTYWSGVQQEEVEIQEAPLVFVGYGVQAPEFNWDDFKGADVHGKVLLFLNNDPPVSEGGEELFGGEARTYYGRWTYKFEQAMRLGAVGAFMIHTTPSASYPFSVVKDMGSEEHFSVRLPDSGYQVPLLGWINEELSKQIAQSMGSDLEGLFEMGKSRAFEPVDTGYTVQAHIESSIRRTEAQNIMGLLEGSDQDLKEQILVISAHYDHMGIKEGPSEEDNLFNGAWDNASGTAAMLSLAKAMVAADPAPRRSILFLAAAAEESGSLGSKWFVARPPFDRSRLVANFNIDMPQIFGVTRDLGAIGVNMNSLGEALREVAQDFRYETPSGETTGVQVTGDPNPNAGSFYRSDQVNFAKAGIPALYIQPGKDYLKELDFDPAEYRERHYHQPSDEVREEWDLAGLVRDLRLLYLTIMEVANADEMPRWNPGNEFEEEWRELHGVLVSGD